MTVIDAVDVVQHLLARIEILERRDLTDDEMQALACFMTRGIDASRKVNGKAPQRDRFDDTLAEIAALPVKPSRDEEIALRNFARA